MIIALNDKTAIKIYKHSKMSLSKLTNIYIDTQWHFVIFIKKKMDLFWLFENKWNLYYKIITSPPFRHKIHFKKNKKKNLLF